MLGRRGFIFQAGLILCIGYKGMWLSSGNNIVLLSLVAIFQQSSSFVFVWLCNCFKALVITVAIVR